MIDEEKAEIKSFMGYPINEYGDIEGAIPVFDVRQQVQNAMKQFAENQNKMILEYCTKLKINPDVLEKQLKEIQMLKMIIKQKDENIEKMKCCANCEWSMVEDTNDTVCIKELEEKYVDSYQHGCKNWELAE